DKIIDEHVAGINGHGIHGSRFEGFLANELDIFALAEVDSKGDDVEVVFLADPRHHDRGVQAAAVGKDDFVPTHDALAGGRNTDHAGGRGSGRHPFTPLPKSFSIRRMVSVVNPISFTTAAVNL